MKVAVEACLVIPPGPWPPLATEAQGRPDRVAAASGKSSLLTPTLAPAKTSTRWPGHKPGGRLAAGCWDCWLGSALCLGQRSRVPQPAPAHHGAQVSARWAAYKGGAGAPARTPRDSARDQEGCSRQAAASLHPAASPSPAGTQPRLPKNRAPWAPPHRPALPAGTEAWAARFSPGQSRKEAQRPRGRGAEPSEMLPVLPSPRALTPCVPLPPPHSLHCTSLPSPSRRDCRTNAAKLAPNPKTRRQEQETAFH